MKEKIIKFCCLGLILSLVAVSFSGCRLFHKKKKHRDDGMVGVFSMPIPEEKSHNDDKHNDDEEEQDPHKDPPEGPQGGGGDQKPPEDKEGPQGGGGGEKPPEDEKAKHPDTVRDYKMWENRPYKGFIWQTHWKVHEECKWQEHPGEIVQEPVWPDYEWNDVEPGFQQHTVTQRADGYKCNCTRTYGE